jgi:hypothetical protein
MEVRVFIKEDKIFVLPDREIMDIVDEITKSPDVDVAKSMKMINSLDKKQKILTMNYIMEGDDNKSRAVIQQESNKILQESTK